MSIMGILLYLVVWGLILYVLWWAVGKLALPEPFSKIATVVLVFLTVFVLLNLLFGFVGGMPSLGMKFPKTIN